MQGALRPDYTFLFDLEADVGLARAWSRGETDRFEQQHIDFFNLVRAQYLKMAETEPLRFQIIHAQYDLKSVQQQITIILKQLFAI